jgi:hypothetical protein
MLSIPIVLLFALPFGPAKMMGAGLLVLVLGIASLGAAGIAAFMAAVMAERSGSKPNGIGNFLRAAVALELGAAFPFIGWFLVIPVGVITSLGAAALSLLRWKSAKGVSAIPATEMQGLSNDAVAS